MRYPFALSLILVVYAWAVYPALLWFLQKVFARPVAKGKSAIKPFVSIIVAVHNEETEIETKLEDCLNLEYPHDRVEVLIVSDGSTDRTEEIVQACAGRDARIRLLRSQRVGKSGAQNLAVELARGEILVFSDAGTRTEPKVLEALVGNFGDPQVGLVTGIVCFGHPGEAELKGQGFYWNYEFFLRQAESDIGTLATATGTSLAIRRELFRPMEARYGDDCILPLDVRLEGYRVVQEPKAMVYDTMPHTMDGELRARVRMVARNWTGTLSRPALLNPFRYPLTAVGLISHKLLRWLTPFLLVALFVFNTVLVFRQEQFLLWGVQILFYVSALIGWRLARRNRAAGVFAYPFSFCLANVGFVMGIFKAVRHQRIVAY